MSWRLPSFKVWMFRSVILSYMVVGRFYGSLNPLFEPGGGSIFVFGYFVHPMGTRDLKLLDPGN